MTNNISNKDKKDWKNFLSNKEKLFDKDLSKDNTKPLISKTLDLHGFSLDEANQKVEFFLKAMPLMLVLHLPQRLNSYEIERRILFYKKNER